MKTIGEVGLALREGLSKGKAEETEASGAKDLYHCCAVQRTERRGEREG